eukprot:scaffold250094_cov52-Prasinocladus_malaysianus.AAC.1
MYVPQTVKSMLYYRNRMIIGLETWELAPVLRDRMGRMIAAVDEAVMSMGDTLSAFDYEAVRKTYAELKSEVCCSVVGTAGMQWLFLLCVGFTLLAASGFLFAIIFLMDRLEVH